MSQSVVAPPAEHPVLGKLRAEVKRKWVDALRSGRYRQGQGYLRYAADEDHGDRFCCLGVLCDLAAQEGVTIHAIVDDDDGGLASRYGGSSVLPPRSVIDWAYEQPPTRTWAWFVRARGRDSAAAGEQSLTELNDCQGYGFDRIADVIEKEL